MHIVIFFFFFFPPRHHKPLNNLGSFQGRSFPFSLRSLPGVQGRGAQSPRLKETLTHRNTPCHRRCHLLLLLLLPPVLPSALYPRSVLHHFISHPSSSASPHDHCPCHWLGSSFVSPSFLHFQLALLPLSSFVSFLHLASSCFLFSTFHFFTIALGNLFMFFDFLSSIYSHDVSITPFLPIIWTISSTFLTNHPLEKEKIHTRCLYS